LSGCAKRTGFFRSGDPGRSKNAINVFTPKHGSWLNLVEAFFSKIARSMLRHIRVASKAELKARILAYLDDLNRDPVVHTWTYKIDEAA
jgi:transposase